jgi:hypothetical protein
MSKATTTAINAYDPYGSPPGQEHNAQAPQATDGNASTFWQTEHYDNPPSLGKPGVGLILDAHQPVQLHQLGIATGTPGFTAEIKAGSSPTGPFNTVVGASQTVVDGTRFEIAKGNTYRYYLIWITALPAGSAVAQINEVRAN